MYRGSKITVVMPVHNEQAHIERAIARVPAFVDHIIAVDDGSTDETLKRLAQIRDERLIVISHPKNQGVGAASKTGYRRGLSTGADLIAIMDGDGQMDGGDLHRLLDRALDGIDYVKGNRFLNAKSVASMPRFRYAGNRVFSYLTKLAASFEGSLDAHCGYTVIRRRALELIPLDGLYDRYGFPTEMFFAAHRAGLAIENVSVATIYGDEVSGINPLTAVPTVLFLIARNYLRRTLGARRGGRALTLKAASAESAE
ncbi:MAG TPA: glycosyltransferase family 2 protein [Blastocatellia bacterium]|nr:glycosyltransferase family 2 protein [Blastocatellia bacterium]